MNDEYGKPIDLEFNKLVPLIFPYKKLPTLALLYGCVQDKGLVDT